MTIFLASSTIFSDKLQSRDVLFFFWGGGEQGPQPFLWASSRAAVMEPII
jgi:hypothetical protein